MTDVRLAVVGTRALAHPDDRYRAADRIELAIARLEPAVVISGGADGVDLIAETVAGRMGYTEDDNTLIVLRPSVRRFHGPGGYRQRDGWIAHECTHLLRLACRAATTYGSGWTADEAERLGRIVVRDNPCPPLEE